MNFHVFLLFFNVMVTMVFVSGIVLWILRRDYLPVIRRLEREEEARSHPPTEGRRDAEPGDKG